MDPTDRAQDLAHRSNRFTARSTSCRRPARSTRPSASTTGCRATSRRGQRRWARCRASVVIATFFNFDPDLVRSSMDGIWDQVTPEAVSAARLRAADRMLRRLAPEARRRRRHHRRPPSSHARRRSPPASAPRAGRCSPATRARLAGRTASGALACTDSSAGVPRRRPCRRADRGGAERLRGARHARRGRRRARGHPQRPRVSAPVTTGLPPRSGSARSAGSIPTSRSPTSVGNGGRGSNSAPTNSPPLPTMRSASMAAIDCATWPTAQHGRWRRRSDERSRDYVVTPIGWVVSPRTGPRRRRLGGRRERRSASTPIASRATRSPGSTRSRTSRSSSSSTVRRGEGQHRRPTSSWERGLAEGRDLRPAGQFSPEPPRTDHVRAGRRRRPRRPRPRARCHRCAPRCSTSSRSFGSSSRVRRSVNPPGSAS